MSTAPSSPDMVLNNPIAWLERVTGFLLAAAILAPLLYLPMYSAEPFKVPAEAVIVTAAWIFAFFVETVSVLGGRAPFAGARGSATVRWLLALAVWLGLNSMLGIAPSEHWAYAGTVFGYFILGFATLDWLVRSGTFARHVLLSGLAGIVFFEAILCCFQMRHFGFIDFGQRIQPGGYFAGYMNVLGATAVEGSPIGTLGNRNYVGELLALAWPILLGAALSMGDRRLKLASGVALLLPVLVLFESTCRAAFLGLIVFAPVAAVMTFGISSLSPKRWLSTRQGRVLTGTIGAAMALAMVFAGGPMMQKLHAVNADQLDLESRLINWKAASMIWLEHPVWGAGLGSFKVLDVEKLRQAFPAGLPHSACVVRFYEAHNEPMQTLAELGLLGLVLIVCALATWAYSTSRNESLPAWQRFGLLWGVGAVVFASCFGFPFHIPLTAMVFTFAIALGLSKAPTAPQLDFRITRQSLGRAAIVAVVLAGLGAHEIIEDVIPFFRAYTEQYDANQAYYRQDYPTMDKLYRQALQDNRFKGTVLTQTLSCLYHARQYQAMVTLFEENIHEGYGMDALTMKADALVELGRLDEAAKDYDAILHYYSKDHPNYARAYHQMARIAQLRGHS